MPETISYLPYNIEVTAATIIKQIKFEGVDPQNTDRIKELCSVPPGSHPESKAIGANGVSTAKMAAPREAELDAAEKATDTIYTKVIQMLGGKNNNV